MNSKTFIFAGPQGCGKGTQVALLRNYLKKIDPERPQFQVISGDKLRAFKEGESFSAHLTKDRIGRGELAPLFLVIYLWAEEYIKNITGNEHIFIDGSPRVIEESYAIDSAMKFYKREKPYLIYITLPREESKTRLMKRARHDDTEESLNKRLEWSEKFTVPAIEYLKNTGDYEYIEINGLQSIEEVEKEIHSKLGLE